MPNTKINLLVVDDDAINTFIIKKIVEKTGFSVQMEKKSNGLVAINYLNECLNNPVLLPDLILIDINMPVLNGWEFLDTYATINITKPIAIYMLSSSVYENDIEKAKKYQSVKGFISKPISIPRLKELFEALPKN